MSQRDHGLNESVAAVTTPTSPRKRQKTGKEIRSDSNQDSPSKQVPAMSADAASPDEAIPTTPPPDNKVQMTIRSQPQGEMKTSTHFSSQEAEEHAVANGTNSGPVGGADGSADSPPVIAIDDDDDDDDDVELIADCTTTGTIQFEYDAETYFRQFPFATHGNYLGAIRSVAQHFHGGTALEGTVLPQIAVWLDNLPDQPLQRRSFFTQKSAFWEELYSVVNRVLHRRALFGDNFTDESQSEGEIFSTFLCAYLRICARLFQADAELLAQWSSPEACMMPLVSPKHLRLVHLIFRPERTSLFHLLSKEYRVDTQAMDRRLLRTFIRADGFKNLFSFADYACGKASASLHNLIALWVPLILDSAGWALYGTQDTEHLVDEPQLYRDMLHFFRRYDYDLQSPAKVADTGQTKDIVSHFSQLLHGLCQWDGTIAAELVEEIWHFRDPESPTTASSPVEQTHINKDTYYRDPTLFPALVKHAWKFKLLRKYIVKGRMELRVMSIGTMDNALVEIWKEYNDQPLGVNHPVMQYLADFLLQERVVDYIISVDSHPQLISRSGNIVGFLVVTSRYSESQTDAIWNTVSNSSDPRVVSATMTMLRSIINLMQPHEMLYLLTKMHDLPIESCTFDIIRFAREIAPRISIPSWSGTDMKARPWNVCIRFMQDTSPDKGTSKLFLALHREAAEQLQLVSSIIGSDERHDIYRQCAAHIAKRSPKATGSVHAIYIILTTTCFVDADFFEANSEVTRQILEEICAFIRSEDGIDLNTPQFIAMNYRLEMVSLLIYRATKAIPADLYVELWDHLVGKYAQTRQLRDLAWSKLLDAMRNRPDNEFCKQLISVYVPKLEPQYYTIGLYSFVAAYRFPTTRRIVETSDGKKELLQIRGADLLWSMILSAPPGSIEDRTATLLANRYLELDSAHGITLQEVEEAHIALVEQCTHELLSAYKVLRNKATGNGDQMEIVLTELAKQQKERQFTRTVLFLKLLLISIRTKAEFNHARRSDSKVEQVQPLDDEEPPHGDVVEIKYQTSSNEKQAIVVGSENTLHDVHKRLCHATGFSKINLFAKGKKIDVAKEGSRKVAHLDLVGHLILVQKAPRSEVSLPVADTSGPCSVFERAALNRFDELFACMDSEDSMSSTLYDFLLCFPYPERITESVTTGTCTVDDIFPPARHFQASYAAWAMNHELDQQLLSNTVDDKYLVHGVRLLDLALLNPALTIECSYRSHVILAGTLVQVFTKFLKERPSTELSSPYFSNENLLVLRLLKLLSVSLSAEPSTRYAFYSYAAIIEASLHSRAIWDAFTSNPDAPALHKSLLLDSPRQELRDEIAKTISSVCGGALSPSSALAETDTATCFWNLISYVLPHAVERPAQSEQLFDLADQVFRKYDEYDREEATLRSYLAEWSDVLLDYRHIEVVGRGETDFVVLGLSKLLLSCISSLKSFKKPLNAGQLIERIWNKFMFIPKIVDLEEELSNSQGPILESKTRKELFDLVLALAEDRSSYKQLLDLGINLGVEESDFARLSSFDIDRREAIRSPTGYLGLNNPRAICYMNSLLAQLYMNVNFRRFMLGISVADPIAAQRLLQETQKLFANMQNSYRKWADPQSFAACVRVPDGGSIDINIQMDADEFYNLLFDQWEAQMISPEIKQRFRSFYGGQTVNQIKSKECEHVSERLESFFVVQCDVQGKANLNESLQAFVEGDVMEGENKYKCESCGGRLVDAVKRTCLKDVPDNLIFHLKRFDFDLVSLSRAKINDQFDFPMAIDVSPFKVEHLSDPTKPRQEDWFDLVGVLVHQGSSEAGHYYSYIRSRPCPTEAGTQWHEFNDRDVDAFDPQYIAQRAFGGWIDQYQRQLKNFSAYMLFYQRRSAITKDRSEYSDSLGSGIVKVPVPPAMDQEISTDNDNCIREYSMFDPYHTKFVRQVLANIRKVNHGTCSEDHELETQALRIVLEHLFQVHIRVRTPDNFEETLLQLRKSVLSCSTCCDAALRWLATHDSALLNMFILCEESKVRSLSRAFLIDCLRFLRDQDPAAYGLESTEIDSDTEPVIPGQCVLPSIVEQLRLVVAESSFLSIRSWDDFYLTLCQISDMGCFETAVLLTVNFLEFCLCIFCMPAAPSLQQRDPDIWRVTEKRRRVYNRMVEFVYSLLSKIDLALPIVDTRHNNINRLDTYDRNKSKFAMSLGEQYWLHFWYDDNKAFAALDRMLETFDVTKTEVFYPGEVLKWMMQWVDPLVHQRLHTTVLEGVNQLVPPASDPYVRAALPFCETSTESSYVDQIVEAVAKSATKTEKYGGEAHIHFFMGLLHAENDAVFEEKGDEYFFQLSLHFAKKFAIPLLIFDDDSVRRLTAKHLEELFTTFKAELNSEEDTLKIKYKAVRVLINEMLRRIEEENRNGTSRSYMQPTITTCGVLVQILKLLAENDEPQFDIYRSSLDAELLQYYEALESQLGSWPLDEGSPQSLGEGFASDYGSESDMDGELLDTM